MKPSERRELKQRQQEMREAAEREAEQERLREQQNTASEDGHSESEQSEPKNESSGYVRKEGFFQSNVRLITAIITISVLLILIGPYNIFHIVRDLSERSNQVTDRDDLTLEHVFNIAEFGDNISWGNFQNFNYNDQSFKTDDGDFVKREYPVKGTEFMVLVGGKSLREWPSFVYLIDYDSGELIDMRSENARKFVEELNEKKQEQKE